MMYIISLIGFLITQSGDNLIFDLKKNLVSVGPVRAGVVNLLDLDEKYDEKMDSYESQDITITARYRILKHRYHYISEGKELGEKKYFSPAFQVIISYRTEKYFPQKWENYQSVNYNDTLYYYKDSPCEEEGEESYRELVVINKVNQYFLKSTIRYRKYMMIQAYKTGFNIHLDVNEKKK